ERGRAVGIWSGFAVSGSILGMLLSGALLERFSWVSTFVATAALAGVAFGAAAVLAPNTADPHPARLDTVGSVLSGVGIGGLVFGIIEGAERGWLNPLSVAGFTVAARVGVRPVLAGGMATIAVGFLLLARLQVHSTYWSFLVGLGVFGVGVSLASTPATTAIVGSLPRAKQGVASAVNDVSRELGSAIGIATLGSLFNRGYANAIKSTTGLPASVAGIVRRSPAAGLNLAGHIGPNGTALAHSVKSAFIHGLGAALVGGAIL